MSRRFRMAPACSRAWADTTRPVGWMKPSHSRWSRTCGDSFRLTSYRLPGRSSRFRPEVDEAHRLNAGRAHAVEVPDPLRFLRDVLFEPVQAAAAKRTLVRLQLTLALPTSRYRANWTVTSASCLLKLLPSPGRRWRSRVSQELASPPAHRAAAAVSAAARPSQLSPPVGSRLRAGARSMSRSAVCKQAAANGLVQAATLRLLASSWSSRRHRPPSPHPAAYGLEGAAAHLRVRLQRAVTVTISSCSRSACSP